MKEKEPEKQILTLVAAWEISGIPTLKLAKYCRDRQIPGAFAIGIGDSPRAWRIYRKEFMEWLDKRGRDCMSI